MTTATVPSLDDPSLPWRSSVLNQPVRLRLSAASAVGDTTKDPSSLPAETILQKWDQIVAKYGDRPALHQKVGTSTADPDIPWTTWTWREYQDQVHRFGKALLSLNFQPFDTINIIGFNAPEWFFANYGAMAAGGVSAGIYSTNQPEACYYIAHHSRAKVIVCEGPKQLAKFYAISAQLKSHLKAIVMYGPEPIPADAASKCAVPIYTFADFLALGTAVTDEALQTVAQAWQPNHVCTLIYTSGTTGPPKAVMITHDNITWTVQSLLLTLSQPLDNTDVFVSYLPLSHIAGQMIDMHQALITGAQIYFAAPDALKGSLGKTLKDVRPTIFFGVPRVWEKIYDKMQEVAKTVTGTKKMVSTWAKSTALAHWESVEYGKQPSSIYTVEYALSLASTPLYYTAKLILGQVHAALGFDRCNGFYVSAAPIEVSILKYFASLDIPILELFGQSECTGPHTINRYSAFKFGTVGRPLPGTKSKIHEVANEYCINGRHVFAGYLGMDDKTIETIDADGWLHTGDVVHVDDDHDPDIEPPSGFNTITGRIKELIITAGGENVPPVLIEHELKLAMPAVSNAMVIGDKRKFLSVLLTLQVEIGPDELPTNKLTGKTLEVGAEIGSTATTTEEAAKDPKWHAYFDEGVKVANAKATSRAQAVGKWSLLPTDFSEKGGELTPTLKLKRSVAAEKYASSIEAMYA